MNTSLIVTPRQIDGELTQTVDARDLHAFLGVTTEHGKWIARRIESYDFIEGTDFFCSTEVASKGQGRGGHNRAIYHLTLDMAKQVSMVERTAKGREAREYFIACERRAKAAAQQMPALPADLDARLERIEQQVALQTPKVLAFERLTDQRGAVSMREAAKLLSRKPRSLQALLFQEKWIFRSGEHGGLQAFQTRIDQGLLVHRMFEVEHRSGFTSRRPQALVTPKGLAKLAALLESIPSINPNPRSRAPTRSINRS